MYMSSTEVLFYLLWIHLNNCLFDKQLTDSIQSNRFIIKKMASRDSQLPFILGSNNFERKYPYIS